MCRRAAAGCPLTQRKNTELIAITAIFNNLGCMIIGDS